MSAKKWYTKKQFELLRGRLSRAMAKNKKLRQSALKVLIEADRYRWIHQSNWLGEPILNLPQDMFAIQEIIFKTRPKFIIELGVGWGGSLLFYSTLMEVLKGGRVIGVDINIPDDLKQQLFLHKRLSKRIKLIKGSSIDHNIFNQIKSIIGRCKAVMVILDSYHTQAHVLKELRLYSELIGKGFYLVCADTIIEDIPKQKHRLRPWGPGNSPRTALLEFFKENTRFKIDYAVSDKLLLTCNPGGYLRCKKD